MMHKVFLTAVLLLGLVLGAALPARADDSPLLLLDWGSAETTYTTNLESIGLLVRVSDQGGFEALYLDTGVDFNETRVILSLGLTLRSPRVLFIFRPYAGWGLSYSLDSYAAAWTASPFMRFGAEFICVYWEEEVYLTVAPEIATRAGLRLHF